MCPLNNDILLLIFDQVDKKQDCLTLLLICRQWYSLLLTKAYQSVRLGSDQIHLLVRSVQNNPEISHAIKDLSITSGWRSENDYNVEPLIDTVKQVSPGDWERWVDGLRDGEGDAWLAILTLFVTSVTSLSLNISGDSRFFLPMVARVAARDKPFDSKSVLQHLKIVELETDDLKNSYYATDCLPFLKLPSMRMFRASGLCEEQRGEPAFSKPGPRTSGVIELDFGLGPCNGRKGMNDFIAACANLEVFEYQHDDKAVWAESYVGFRPRAFYNALCTQKHSLRELRLNNTGESHSDDIDSEDDDGSVAWDDFGSLADFGQLRELHIPVRTLLQIGPHNRPPCSLDRVLPPNLELLNLAYYYQEDFGIVIENLHSLLKHKEHRFCNLREIQVQPYCVLLKPGAIPHWSNFIIPDLVQKGFTPFKEECNRLGVDFNFTKHGNHRVIRPT
ncbi:uncharacterized protein BO97DRAFT_399005 [Aspergillus homomorphus CBS 101889]|uniref:Leucine-rich repeat domain-containing protein n=1 Tax=Aspergillus homomorphus (strain CBS 101889) TaxID=1450537 RepID=A0A395HJS8_ASPHC|nr:hypothetical protein BO97DRAFT_399005 [Aspergillus homomorphus CBS 101889]RAL08077.1 hypothetical protein BO97DRAFT_399005 [Aspergillus homomorphus CBS 101889]